MAKAPVGTVEATTPLSELLDRVVAGETITIVRDGYPVAELRPIAGNTGEAARAAINRIIERRAEVKPDPEGWTVFDYIAYGRRY